MYYKELSGTIFVLSPWADPPKLHECHLLILLPVKLTTWHMPKKQS